MRRIIYLLVITVSLSSSLHAADDPLEKGMQLYKKHRFGEAADVLRPALSGIKPNKRGSAYLGLGMIYLKNAELHRELYRASLSVNLDYLKGLSSVKGKARSRFVNLYLGETLLEKGGPKRAASYLRKFIGEKRVNAESKAVAKVSLGLCYYRLGDKQKAMDLWTHIKKKTPKVLSELAAAYAAVGLKKKNPVAMCDKLVGSAKKSGKKPSIRTIKNIIAVYAETGDIDKGLDMIRDAGLENFSYEEVPARNKAIRFYDISLLNSLSKLYGKASLTYLQKAAEDAGVMNVAHYFLGQSHALLGNIDESNKSIETVISHKRIPREYRNTAAVMQAANLYRKGKKAEAKERLNTLSNKLAAPDLAAGIIFACGELGIECNEIVSKASAISEKGAGKKMSRLNFALGKYHLREKRYEKAVSYMEAGRDKSNKNRIAYNDPLMLVNLAEAYYRTKKFSEALEIYFEMSKHFPAIRQIQAALQGIYSMEQKSAGDVKIF